MRISVIGCGYLGAVHAAAMAQLGHEVVGVDVDAKKVEALSNAQAPFFEPGLPELLAETAASGRLRFTTDMSEIAGAQVHFICVGTPQKRGEFGADMAYVDAAFEGVLATSGPTTSSSASPRSRWAPRSGSPSAWSTPARPRRSCGTPSSCARASR